MAGKQHMIYVSRELVAKFSKEKEKSRLVNQLLKEYYDPEARKKLRKRTDLQAPHEEVLDDFIDRGNEKLKAGNLPITSTNLLRAIQTRADIDMKNKDRGLEAAKAFFLGQNSNAPSEDEQSEESKQFVDAITPT